MAEYDRDKEVAELRDVKLLRELSEHFTIPLEMTDLGIVLGILPRLIASCLEENKDSIQSAVFYILHNLWHGIKMDLDRIVTDC